MKANLRYDQLEECIRKLSSEEFRVHSSRTQCSSIFAFLNPNKLLLKVETFPEEIMKLKIAPVVHKSSFIHKSNLHRVTEINKSKLQQEITSWKFTPSKGCLELLIESIRGLSQIKPSQNPSHEVLRNLLLLVEIIVGSTNRCFEKTGKYFHNWFVGLVYLPDPQLSWQVLDVLRKIKP